MVFNPNDNVNKFVAGNLPEHKLREIDDYVSTQTSVSPFIRMVVLEVISDPIVAMIDDKKKAFWSSTYHVQNIDYCNILPRNTIIAREQGNEHRAMFCFPFFPSHLSLPCKAGEVVWAMYQDPLANDKDTLAYWICKVVQPHFVDDVNHTHAPRIHEPSYGDSSLRQRQSNNGLTDPYHELRNGPVKVNDGNRTTVAYNRFLIDEDDTVFEKIVMKTEAGQMTQYEAVPRFKKRPGDIALEGSNNSLIVLGTDRVGPSSDLLVDPKYGYMKTVPTQNDLQQSAGSIDIVVGRGQTVTTFGKEASTTSINSSGPNKKGDVIKKELDKSKDAISKNEGDLDFKNDRSRILISQRTTPDKNFSLDKYNSNYDINDSSTGDASIVNKSDKIRILARSDVEILSTGYQTKKSPVGQDIKEENVDDKNWASVILKNDGNVIISNAKDKTFSVGPHKDSNDRSKALLTLDSEKNEFIAPLANSGTAIIGSSEKSSALGVFDNGSHTITLGGGNAATALEVIDVDQKLVTIGTALGVFDVKSGAVSIGGGALMVAGPPGGTGTSPGLPASSVAYSKEVNDIVTQINLVFDALTAYTTAIAAIADPTAIATPTLATVINSAKASIAVSLKTLGSKNTKVQ